MAMTRSNTRAIHTEDLRIRLNLALLDLKTANAENDRLRAALTGILYWYQNLSNPGEISGIELTARLREARAALAKE